MDLTQALAPKSDQLDAADLIGSPPRIFTITEVVANGAELADQQPVNIHLAEFPRVWRPSKGMLRVLADNWGKDVKVWAGRYVELYGEPEVYFGKEKRGGTRISRLSHITGSKKTLVNPRGGKGAYWAVDPMPEPSRLDLIKSEWPTASPSRQEEIRAEVAALQAHPDDPGADYVPAPRRDKEAEPETVELPEGDVDPTLDPAWGGE